MQTVILDLSHFSLTHKPHSTGRQAKSGGQFSHTESQVLSAWRNQLTGSLVASSVLPSLNEGQPLSSDIQQVFGHPLLYGAKKRDVLSKLAMA